MNEMTALVVDADSPLDNMIRIGPQTWGMVRIYVEDASPPIYTAARFKLDRDHWLVAGMKIPVMIDQATPNEFQINWDAIPSMRDLVSANDPALADPVGTRKRIGEIVQDATSPIDVSKLPEEIRAMLREHEAKIPPPVDHAAEAEAAATMSPATSECCGGRSYRTADGRHDAVLSVRAMGRAPYAVFVHNFRQPAGRRDIMGSGLPALVSQTDPNDIEVLWKEIPSVRSQVTDKLAEATQRMNAAQAQMAEDQKLMMEKIEKDTAAATAAAGAPMPTSVQLPESVLAMMAQNAKVALSVVRDPAQRQMLIQQYKIAGIPIDDEGNVTG
jgi:hypothetical protein